MIKNPFRDLYTHEIWCGNINEYPCYVIYLSIVAGGRYYQIREDAFEFRLSGFWEKDIYEIYRAIRRWHISNDDPSDIEETYGDVLCDQCGKPMSLNKRGVWECGQCYHQIKLSFGRLS